MQNEKKKKRKELKREACKNSEKDKEGQKNIFEQ